MDRQSNYFPVLRIHEFRNHPSEGCDLIFHELHGRRSIDEPHKHDFFIIILFEKGQGSHTIDFIRYETGSRQIHLVFPGQVHQWELESQTVGYQLMICREWFESFLPDLRFPAFSYYHRPILEASDEAFIQLLSEFHSIQSELKGKSVFREIVKTRSRLICLLISRLAAADPENLEKVHPNPLTSKFLALIEDHFREERSVAFYAEKLHISPNYLNIICRRYMHASASSLVYDRVLLEAKRLLGGSEMSVKDIVYELGFYDNSSFSNFFKTRTGMTPSQFKIQRH